MSKRPLVLDSWAVIAFFEAEEPAAEKMEALLADARDNQTPLLMTTVNLGEVWYSLARAYSEREADQAVAQVMSLGVEVVAADWGLAQRAAVFKVKGNISYADCFAAALAQDQRGELVTGDPEFKQLDSKIKIVWL